MMVRRGLGRDFQACLLLHLSQARGSAPSWVPEVKRCSKFVTTGWGNHDGVNLQSVAENTVAKSRLPSLTTSPYEFLCPCNGLVDFSIELRGKWLQYLE